MELRQLRYFVAVAEEGSFTKAANRLHVAQPGVSAQVRQLERELGEDLIDRAGRTVRLTAIGAAVLPHARSALAAAEAMRAAVDEHAGLVRGHVAVGMVVSCASLGLPNLLSRFHQQHPSVEITLKEANSDDLLDALRSGQMDIAFVGLPNASPMGVDTLIVADEPLAAAVSPNDPLAQQTSITLDALHGRQLVCLPRGTGVRTMLDEASKARGFEARIAFEASALRVVAELAIRGLGVAILPESVASAMSDVLHPIAITAPSMRARLALAWRATGPISPAASALIKHARLVLGGEAGTQETGA